MGLLDRDGFLDWNIASIADAPCVLARVRASEVHISLVPTHTIPEVIV